MDTLQQPHQQHARRVRKKGEEHATHRRKRGGGESFIHIGSSKRERKKFVSFCCTHTEGVLVFPFSKGVGTAAAGTRVIKTYERESRDINTHSGGACSRQQQSLIIIFFHICNYCVCCCCCRRRRCRCRGGAEGILVPYPSTAVAAAASKLMTIVLYLEQQQSESAAESVSRAERRADLVYTQHSTHGLYLYKCIRAVCVAYPT